MARSDYAINCGSNASNSLTWGPNTGPPATVGPDGYYPDGLGPNGSLVVTAGQTSFFATARGYASLAVTVAQDELIFNGISFELSMIRKDDITDGCSNTLLIGEKFMGPEYYYTGTQWSDDQDAYQGFDNDTFRMTNQAPLRDYVAHRPA